MCTCYVFTAGMSQAHSLTFKLQSAERAHTHVASNSINAYAVHVVLPTLMNMLHCLQAAEQPPLAQAAAQPGKHWGFAEACAELWKPYLRNRDADRFYKSRKFTDAELHGHHK